MEPKSNSENGCYGGVNCALPACENPALWVAAVIQDVTTYKYIDSSINTDLACDIDHNPSPLSAFMPGSALSLEEAASLQPVGKVKSPREWPHAEPIHTNSVSNGRSVQVRHGPQDGVSPVAPFLLKVSCGWADEFGKGSSLLMSWFY